MKSLSAYLTESTKTYRFKITVAGDLEKDTAERLKAAAGRYDVISMSSPKRLPIQRSADFPSLGPTELSLVDLEVRYPVTPEQLRTAFADACSGRHFVVRTLAQSADAPPVIETEGEEEAKEALLTSELVDEDYSDFRTDSQVDNLMKEFAAMAAQYEGPKGDKAKTTNDLPQGNSSAVGSNKTQHKDLTK
jgi:hypothetical protein